MLGPLSVTKGSGVLTAPVTGAGLKLAFPLLLGLPTTLMPDALTDALPLAEIAELELESMANSPGMLMLALPEMERAPPAVGSSTKIDGATETVKVWTKLHAV